MLAKLSGIYDEVNKLKAKDLNEKAEEKYKSDLKSALEEAKTEAKKNGIIVEADIIKYAKEKVDRPTLIEGD